MKKIVLASSSPRRQELLAKMGLDFIVEPSNFDEQLDDDRTVEEVAKELALGKALDVARQFPDALVIGSDNIVTLHGRQLGKQPDAQSARQLLREMSGQKIEVFCAVALVCERTGLRDVRFDRAAIVYAPYDEAVIDNFLASNEWQDKAGATSVQSALTPPVDHIQGDYDTILGLSTSLLAKMLAEQGIKAQSHSPKHPHAQKQLA